MADKKIFNTKPIVYNTFSRSPVDIIIPFHGQYFKVSKLIQSILIATRSNPYQICLVDDASPNASFIKDMENVPQTVTVRSDERLGFGGALKLGFDSTHQPWVVFLNSDCLIEDPNWLIEMGKTLVNLREANVRMVSAKSNNPGIGADHRLKADREGKTKDFILNEGFLPLYCVMAHRQLFSRIGGFVKSYPYGTYEDEELAFRMKHYDFKQGICGKSWVRHEGGATFDALVKKNPEIVEILESNRDRCIRDMKILS